MIHFVFIQLLTWAFFAHGGMGWIDFPKNSLLAVVINSLSFLKEKLYSRLVSRKPTFMKYFHTNLRFLFPEIPAKQKGVQSIILADFWALSSKGLHLKIPNLCEHKRGCLQHMESTLWILHRYRYRWFIIAQVSSEITGNPGLHLGWKI